MRAGAGLTATLHRPSTLQPCVLCSLRCHKTRPPPIPKVLYRGAKSRTTLQLTDLPQNVIRSEKLVKLKENEGPVYPTVLRQVRSNMQKFENCVILTRVGGFYELYFEHAEEYGPLLNLKVAQKPTLAGPVSMSGFPFYQLDRFLKILVQDLNKYVGISEEFANNALAKVKSGGLLFDRKVTRIITPGTLIDEKFMDPYENNYLLAIQPKGTTLHSCSDEIPAELIKDTMHPELAAQSVGLAWLDLSTGDFFTQASTMGGLPSAVARIGAREIVLSDSNDKSLQQSILSIFENERHLVTYQSPPPEELPFTAWTPMLDTAVLVEKEDVFSAGEIAAGSLLLNYVKEKLQGLGIKLQPPRRRQESETMGIDRSSLKGLEILETSKDGRGGGKGSLLHTVRRTVTQSGARLLKNWIASPSTSLQTVNSRLDLVSHFFYDLALRERITNSLRRSFDSQRLAQKFSMGRGDGDDLVSLLRTIEATNEIVGVLGNHVSSSGTVTGAKSHTLLTQDSVQSLILRMSFDAPNALASRIAMAIDEDGMTQNKRNEEIHIEGVTSMDQDTLQNQGSSEDLDAISHVTGSKGVAKSTAEHDVADDDTWVMRKNANYILQRLHGDLDHLRQKKIRLTTDLREKLRTQSLTLRWSPSSGHVCHVKGVKDVRTSFQTSASAQDIKSTKSTRSFYQSEWSRLGGEIDQAKSQIRAEEQRLFQDLREQVVLNLVDLRRNAAVLDELDIACSFAVLAEEQGFVRPVMNLGTNHKIIGGRHPTVKLGLEEQGRTFVSNDCFIGGEERIWLITGPNMAGKSTFLRQNALITVLAQVGSFVPAEHAEIGIVDQIFSRVGSADNLFRDQSTFMVEMLETAAILKLATARSFVIMDEVGRGTTPEDGIAVSFGCLHHLYYTNRCRTLFATHFHALADMTQSFRNLGCYCTDVAEGHSDSFSYVHRLRRGVNRNSHALKVARLAGIPELAISTAQEVLDTFGSKAGESTQDSAMQAATA